MSLRLKKNNTKNYTFTYSYLFFLFCTFFVFQGCDRKSSLRQQEISHWNEDDNKIKVLTTTAMINDLVKQIGGEHIKSISLIEGELDPHSYQLVKGDDEKLSQANLLFYNGLGLEHGPSLYHYLIENKKAIALGDLIANENDNLIIHVNNQNDPHIWMDISLWSKTIPYIVKALSELDPNNSQIYHDNGQKLHTEMMKAHQEVRNSLQQVPENKRYLVTSHDAFNYFARAYLAEEGEIASGQWQKRFAAPEGLAPESQLSTTHIKMIIDYLFAHQVFIIFAETNVSRDSIKKIVQAGQEQGLNVNIACCPLYGDAMGPAGSEGDSYLKMIKYNADMLIKHMQDPYKKHT